MYMEDLYNGHVHNLDVCQTRLQSFDAVVLDISYESLAIHIDLLIKANDSLFWEAYTSLNSQSLTTAVMMSTSHCN